MRLSSGGAAKRHHLTLHDAVASNASGVLNVLHLLTVKVFRIIPGDQGHGVARFGRRSLVSKLAFNHVAGCELIDRISGGILRHRDGSARPVHHSPKDRGHVLHDLVGLLPSLEIQVAGKARLKSAQAIGHQLIAILGYSVERPLVDLGLGDIPTQSIAGTGDQVKKAPGRVIGPGDLEGSVPNPAVGPSDGVVIHRDPNP